MKRVLQVAVALLLMAGVANAQTPTTPAVDLNRAIFCGPGSRAQAGWPIILRSNASR